MSRWPTQPQIPAHHSSRAPYNFVPLPEKILLVGEPFSAHDRLDPDRLHGELELTIETQTPLYTRCAHDPADGDNPRDSPGKQRFFHNRDQRVPVIPGSSLRGMTRSLVEILSYSRIGRRMGGSLAGRLRDERLIYRAVADQHTGAGEEYKKAFVGTGNRLPFPSDRVQAGYLERQGGRWHICPAQELLPMIPGRSAPPGYPPLPRSFLRVPANHSAPPAGYLDDVENAPLEAWVQIPPTPQQRRKDGGRIVYYVHYWRATSISLTPPSGGAWFRGWLVPSGPTPPGGRHMHTFVFEQDTSATRLEVPPEMWRLFEDDQRISRGLQCRQVLDAQPRIVFYLLDPSGALVFLGPTLFFRIPYPHATADFVPQQTMVGDLDLAEGLFGTVNKGRRNIANASTSSGSHRGRVFFDDAEWDQQGGDPFLDAEGAAARFPDILSTPKPTSYQHYLIQEANWNTVPDQLNARKQNLVGYEATPPDSAASSDRTTVLRGFKRYWHRRDAAARAALHRRIPQGQPADQYTAIRPVKRGVTFVGRVRFENLTPIELGALLIALDLPESCRHKLGMGKPLGLGTVRVAVKPRLYSPIRRYASVADLGWEADEMVAELAVRSRKEFAAALLEHYKSFYPRSGLSSENPSDLWRIPRFRELRSLLEWEEKPEDQATSYARLQMGGGAAAANNQFRQRKILRPASQVASLNLPDVDSAELELESPPTSPDSSVPSGVPGLHTKGRDAEKTGLAQGSTLLLRVEALPPTQVAGAFQQLFELWNVLTDEAEKLRVGRALVAKVEAHWRKGRAKDHYRTVVEWVKENAIADR